VFFSEIMGTITKVHDHNNERRSRPYKREALELSTTDVEMHVYNAKQNKSGQAAEEN